MIKILGCGLSVSQSVLSVFMTNDTAMRCLLDPFLDETCMFFLFEFSINTFSSPLISSNLYGETWR